jgi:hypothetical protein
MILHTASEGVTLAKKLENDSAKFYEDLAQRYAKEAETFLSFAKDNKKNIVQTERVYFGVITDAIEGCYAFNLDTDNYILETAMPVGATLGDSVKRAIAIEDTIIKFYSDAAEQSKPLLADVPRAFALVARKRSEVRKPQLMALINK